MDVHEAFCAIRAPRSPGRRMLRRGGFGDRRGLRVLFVSVGCHSWAFLRHVFGGAVVLARIGSECEGFVFECSECHAKFGSYPKVSCRREVLGFDTMVIYEYILLHSRWF